MPLAYWRECKYAPTKRSAKHCNKWNEGEGRTAPTTQKQGEKGYHRAPKGQYGCANKCRYFEPK